MTRNSEMAVVKKRGKSREPKREEIPYAVPSDAQIPSYWQYLLQIPLCPVLQHIPHTWVENVSTDEKLKLETVRKRDNDSSLINELRSRNVKKSFSKSQYVRDMRLLSTWRLIAGRKRDGCILLDQQLDIEHKKYLQIRQEYRECVNALERFLSKDHDESMRILSIADAEYAKTDELSDKRDELSRRYGQTRLEVYHWEEAWRTVKACHRFLHRVSPLTNNEDDDPFKDDDDDDDEINEKNKNKVTRESDIGKATSLESIIATFEKEAIGLSKSPAKEPSALGLIESNDLLNLFRDIELQNLNALIHLESLGGPMADMIARIDVAEIRVRKEIDDVLEGIKQLELSIEREELRAQRLERKAERLIQRNFRELICSAEALHTRVLVEDAYDNCVAKNETGLEPLAMARGLENVYEKLSAELDGLPRHLVIACEREGFMQEMKENREIEDAAQKFELMHRLLNALRRIMEPSAPKHRMLMRRSVPKIRSKHRKKISQTEQTTGRETLHFDFFSKSCKQKKKKDLNDDNDENEDDD